MIMEDFDERMVANMEVALSRACERLPKELDSHEVRKRIAVKIVDRATQGGRTLKALTDAAMAAVAVSSTSQRF
jgi:hypothetical protein